MPAASAPLWSPADSVQLSRERMQIAQSLRDFKTQLALRGWGLEVRVDERLGRFLHAFCLAYALLCFLGATPAGAAARADLEIPRLRPRHGTPRTQSVLSLARRMLTHPVHAPRAFRALYRMLGRLARGWPVLPSAKLCLASGPRPP